MADVSQQLAEIIARGKPQIQAQQTPARVISSGPLRSNDTQTSASIDIGAIQKLSALNEQKKAEMINGICHVYNLQKASGKPEEQAAADKIIDESHMQILLRDAFNNHHPLVQQQEVPAPMELPDTSEKQKSSAWTPDEQGNLVQTPNYAPRTIAGTVTRYKPIELAPSMEEQKDIIFKEAPVKTREASTFKPTEDEYYSTSQDTPANPNARQNVLSAHQSLVRTNAAGGIKNPEQLEADRAFDAYYRQYGDEKEKLMAGAADTEDKNFPSNMQLLGAINNYLGKTKVISGSYGDAMHSIDTAINSIDREMNRPTNPQDQGQPERRAAYVKGLTALLKTSEDKDLGHFSKLMDWVFTTYRNDQDVYKYFKDNFKLSDSSFKAAYEDTDVARIRKAAEELRNKKATAVKEDTTKKKESHWYNPATWGKEEVKK